MKPGILATVLCCLASVVAAEPYAFQGRISRTVLENYLARSITMMDLLTGVGSPDDNIRMMKDCGVKFAGRTLYLWGGESRLETLLAKAETVVPNVREADPDIILQAGIFEIVTTQVTAIPVPDRVFLEFDLPVEQRTFNYEAMLFPDGQFVEHWGKGSSVPDMTRLETRMWFFYLAARYIDAGCEAIHFGQVALMGMTDRGYHHWWDMLSRVRAYAETHAARGMVLCDAHTPRGGPRLPDGRLLFDFHSFPLRIEEIPERPEEGILRVGHHDSLYGRSNGGMAPSGWACEHLPYLVEFDNFGRSGKEGQIWGQHWIWGYDEIGWFARQSETYRNDWLDYAWKWIRKNDVNGFLQMPGSRCLAYPVTTPRGTELNWYLANTAGPVTPDGFNQEETIREIWAQDGAYPKESLQRSEDADPDVCSAWIPAEGSTVLIEAEGFEDTGGWVVDQQVMDQMGSPFLLAHGLGRPVADARTSVDFPRPGEYRVWVRTRDWVGQWKVPGLSPAMKAVGSPGVFQLMVDGEAVDTTFGMEGALWHWQDGGVVRIPKTRIDLALHDLTGFDGRCDAVLFSTHHQLVPPNTLQEMKVFRRELLGYPETPPEAGHYDLVVVGGGMAGICTAVSAARGGCRVALIQNRPVLGGNNSSEVRVGLSGLIHQEPYPKLGNLVDEIGPTGHWNLWEANRDPDSPRSRRILEEIRRHPEKKIHNAGPPSNYEDQKKADVVLAEKSLRLFLNMHVHDVTMVSNRIAYVTAQHIRTGERLAFKGDLFADCTGDGNLGFLAGADFRTGREAKSLTGEGLAPEQRDHLVMGTSVQWYAVEESSRSTFPSCPWAVQFDEKTCSPTTRGDWDWETGATYDQVMDFEHVRDYGLRVIYGNWAVLKNHDQFREQYAHRRLAWAAYIGGKRESRRLLGDVIICQHDIQDQRAFDDACVTTTWTIDLHYPKTPLCACDAFRSEARVVSIEPYPIPYRSLYSRNIENLMMAGRNISVTHVALGTVRVQRTTGMMGEVLGMAASLCTKYACRPREVYEKHLPEFKDLLRAGVPPAG